MFWGKHSRFGAVAGLLVIAAPAFAQNLQVQPPDPSFFLAEGHLISDTSLSYRRGTSLYLESLALFTIPPQTGLFSAFKTRQSLYSASQGFQYGAIDDLVLGASESCSYSSTKDEYVQTTGEISASGGGCANPFFSAVYRGLHQSDFAELPVNADLIIGFSPNLTRSAIDHPDTSQGGASGNVGLAVSHVFEDVTVLARADLVIAGQKKLRGNGAVETYTGYEHASLKGEVQYRPAEDVFLTAALHADSAFNTNFSYNYSYEVFGNTYNLIDFSKYKIGWSYQPSVKATYTLIPDFLWASLEYQHGFGPREKLYDAVAFFYPSTGGLTSEYVHNAQDAILFNFRVLWF